MGRRKIEIKPIKDDRNRSVTFLKRKGGLFKKAHELSVLCSVDVAVVIFGNNKKLYQYSSGDINEIIGRHSYYDAPHESKGPADFAGKRDLGDDDDDDDAIVDNRAGSHSSADHPLPHHMQRPSIHLNNRQPTASASPPNMPKNLVPGYTMGPRVGTPQPMTRPPSGQAQRRNSSNLVPPNGYAAAQPQQNGYPYIQHQQQQHQPQQQPQQHHPQHPPQHQPQHALQHQPQPPYMQSSGLAYPPYAPPPQHHQPQTAAQAQAEAYINETRRQSMPPAYPEPAASEGEQPPRSEPPAPQPIESHKRAPAKSRSMFTPIGPSESMLAQHFGFGGTQEAARSHTVDVGSVQRKNAAEAAAKQEEKAVPAAQPPPPIPVSTSPPPLSRNNSMADPKSAGMRPKLKVRIPSENSDAGSPSASPREASGNAGNVSARPNNDNGPVVLPPPSPSHSVGGLLSAGATGPVNPFSRPPPAASQVEHTPMSALPSRFTDSMLGSPSSTFYGADWLGLPFPRGAGSSDVLPSPLNFQTPVGTSNPAPFFKSEATDTNSKRRSPESDHSEGSTAKRQKTS